MQESIYTATSGVAVLVFKRTERGLVVMLSERLDSKRSLFRKWAAAGGDVELHELFSPVLTAQREAAEECGLEVEASRFRFLGAATDSDAKPCLFYTILVEPDFVPQNIEPHKHSPWQFFTVVETAELDMSERTFKYIQKAAKIHG